jgi:type IV secretion system protein VirD4
MKAHQDFNLGQARPLKLPERIEDSGLLVGWSLDADGERLPWGFSSGSPELTPKTGFLDPILLAGEGHLITIAPTGAGKGRCCIIPALLRHEGPLIVIDPKGENAAVTARSRREMGDRVVLIDPFRITGGAADAFNPLDVIEADSVESVDLAQAFAHALADMSDADPGNAYWYQRSTFLLSSLILHACCHPDPNRRNLGEVRRLLMALVQEQRDAEEEKRDPNEKRPDGPTTQAVANSPHPAAREALSLLKSGAREGLGSILSIAEDAVGFIRGPQVGASVDRSSFDLAGVTRGDPLAIYLVVPPHHLESHGRLLRMWIMALLKLLTRRQGRPKRTTLFILDEAAQLGPLAELRQAVTLLRGYGVQTWSFWQDVSQLEALYPRDWQTIVNNCAVLQCFGAQNRMAADGMARLTGFRRDNDGDSILALNPYEMILQMGGRPPVIARKPDYCSDPPFSGQYDRNPFHDPDRDIMPPPAARMQLHSETDEPPTITQPPPRPFWHGSATRRPHPPAPDPLLDRLLAIWGIE